MDFNGTFWDSLVTNTIVHLLFYFFYPNDFWGFPYQTKNFPIISVIYFVTVGMHLTSLQKQVKSNLLRMMLGGGVMCDSHVTVGGGCNIDSLVTISMFYCMFCH